MVAEQVIAGSNMQRAGLASELVAHYRARTPKSAALHQEARTVLPGGDTRTIAFHQPYPLAIWEGQGASIQDADGNEYYDFINNYTSLIHGHAHPAVVAASIAQMQHGTAFPAPNPHQTRLAEIITGRVASVDLVRFCNSGSEAVMNAIRAARAFTGRDLLVKMEGGYHGTYDDVEISVHPDFDTVEAGPDDAPNPTVDARGVPTNSVDAVTVLPFNNIEAAERLFRERGNEIAAVIVEPVMGAAGMLPADAAYLDALRALTIESGALLILDEVMSFRLMPGGMQEQYRIRPDLTTFAKIIGGGFPVGAFGGRAAIMEQFDPAKPDAMSQSGTFNGNAVTMAAGVAAMEAYPAAEVARINALGERLRTGLADAVVKSGVSAAVTGFGSFAAVHVGVNRVHNYRESVAGDREGAKMLHLALLEQGIFCAPRGSWCTSTAMNETIIDDAVGRFNRALATVRPALIG